MVRRSSLVRVSTLVGFSATGPRAEDFRLKVLSMVMNATEASLTDTEAMSHQSALVEIANSGGPSRVYARRHMTLGIRKRLKDNNPKVVVNTIRLLSGLMRTCPYYYRHIADDKMFRRLWRFVVPHYKTSLLAIIRGGGARETVTDKEPEIAVRVLVLIRVWAEELSVMFNGTADPAAAFFIERYEDKSRNFPFPDVPETNLPWVCPVGPNATAKASAVYAGTSHPREPVAPVSSFLSNFGAGPTTAIRPVGASA